MVQWAGPRVETNRKEGVGNCGKMRLVGKQGRENFLGGMYIRMKGVERPTGQPGRENNGIFEYEPRNPGRSTKSIFSPRACPSMGQWLSFVWWGVGGVFTLSLKREFFFH